MAVQWLGLPLQEVQVRSLIVEVLPAERVCAQSLSHVQLCATPWTVAL